MNSYNIPIIKITNILLWISCIYTCIYRHIHKYIPYLSVLKLSSYTSRDSYICRVVQHNEWNEYLSPFKYQVAKLLNLIDVKVVVPYIKENKLIINTSLGVCVLLLDITTVDHLQCICHVCYLPTWCTYSVLSVSGVHTLLNMCWPLTTLMNLQTVLPFYPGQVNTRK